MEFYEPILNLSNPEQHNTMGVIMSLKEPVDGKSLTEAVEELRVRFPYFYVKAAYKGENVVTVPNELPMTVRNTWNPVNFNSEVSNYHLAAWKYEGQRLAFEISHALTDGAGVFPYIKSVLYLYLSKATGKAFDSADIRLPGDEIPESEIGNPFKNLDIDGIAAPFYKRKPIPDFFRLVNEGHGEKRVFCMKIPESQIMQYCRSVDGSPNVFLSVMLARAARRLDPENEKTITVSVCVDHKAVLGNRDNYHCFVGDAVLDFPKNRNLDDITKACTIARGQLMLQVQPENSMWEIKQLKRMLPPISPDIALASICVSYPGNRSLGPLDPYIEEMYYMTSLSKITDILCEVCCANHNFFVAFMQPFSSEKYFECFLEELRKEGIEYTFLGSEPIRMCGILSLP
ncbi:MAG: hypothetical protein K6G30_05315 [Acetatifactor sp.]|nr:hypothetical protein [Acetatifactor sp.]